MCATVMCNVITVGELHITVGGGGSMMVVCLSICSGGTRTCTYNRQGSFTVQSKAVLYKMKVRYTPVWKYIHVGQKNKKIESFSTFLHAIVRNGVFCRRLGMTIEYIHVKRQEL